MIYVGKVARVRRERSAAFTPLQRPKGKRTGRCWRWTVWGIEAGWSPRSLPAGRFYSKLEVV